MRKFILIMAVVAIASCGDSRLKRENREMEDEIEERRDSLEAKNSHELESARRELTSTDSLLTIVRREHDELHKRVMEASTRLNDRSPEVMRLNALRASRDSLEVEYAKLSHKVKFFLKKTKKTDD